MKQALIDRCWEQPELFHSYMNKKLSHKEGIVRLRDEGRFLEESKEMRELLNKNFQESFT